MRFQSRAKQGTYGSIWEVYSSIEFLFKHILNKKSEYEHNYEPVESGPDDEVIAASSRYIKTSIENCWGKLDEYYKQLDELSVYMAVLVLNPAQKLVFIKY